ncbi:MAG: S1/P1 nuclease [Bacteroidota bacterium]|jgi:hypothetical protein
MKNYSYRLIYVVFFFSFLAQPLSNYAWGRKGHHIIVELAFNRMNQGTREKVMKYLNGMSIQSASTWMDDIRNVPTYKYLETSHYINIPDPNKMPTVAPNDVKRELDKTFNDLNNKEQLDDSIVRLSILKLIHLIGDIHQPLHAGYEKDRGGNDEQVVFEDKKSNLHRLWDTQLIDKLSIDNIVIENHIAALSNRSKRDYSVINVDQWINESQSYLGQLYSIDNKVINENYVLRSKPVIEKQLARAAMRLQRALEMYF